MVVKRDKISMGVIWALTIVLVMLILGGALYLREKRLVEPQSPVAQVAADRGLPTVSETTKSKPEPAQDKFRPSKVSGSGNLTLTVPALWDGSSRLPLDHSCYRSNTSPQVSWAGLPKGTESMALFMDKVTDAGLYSFWVLFDIPPTTSGLPAALPVGPELESGARYGRNDHGVIQYTGPCDPKGKVNYIFRLYALDTKLDLEPGTARSAIDSAMEGHIIDQAELPFIHYKRL